MPDKRPNDGRNPASADTIQMPAPEIGVPATPLTFAAKTNVGLVRTNNEDQYLIVRLRKALDILDTSLDADDRPQLADQEGHVFLVADGIGGRAGGERASAIVVREATHYLLGAAKWFFRLDDPDEHVRLRLLREALDRIDRQIIEAGEDNPALTGMGTTLTAVSIVGRDLFIVHIGDSRAYLYHDGQLKQLTTDHTLTQELVDQGVLTPDQAKTHRLHSVLTNALGGKPGVDADIVKLRLADGDRVLVCTDGLSELVDDGEIAQLLSRHSAPEPACEALVAAALDAGGLDNVTVIVVNT
jgi:serine/threonine protein phosphatase PrpC